MRKTLFHRPIILLGSERSGTNLLASIFDAHPEYCAPPTAHLLRLAFYIEKSHVARSNLEQIELLSRFFSLKSSVWRIDGTEAEIFKHAAERSISPWETSCLLLQMEARAANKHSIFIRENEVPQFFHRIVSSSVEPRILHLVRNPKDHAVSWRRTPTLRGGILRSTNRWRSDVNSILSIIRSLSNETRVSEMRYEDLVQAPEETLRRVVRDLDINFSSALLEHPVRSWTANNNSSQHDAWRNISKSITPESVGSSVSLTLEEASFVEATCGDLMSRFGYSVDHARIAKLTKDDISDLHGRLEQFEPYDKPEWNDLPEEQRQRLQGWSSLFRTI